MEEASNKEDAGIVPLGIPVLAGPGSISRVMVLVGEAQQSHDAYQNPDSGVLNVENSCTSIGLV